MRVVSTSRLLCVVGFVKDVVIVGNGDHIEIWDEERWNQFLLDTDLTALCM